MSQSRHPKRQRKKEAAAARRQAYMEAMQRRRRTRTIGITGATAALLLGGGAIAFVATTGGPKETPTPKPTPSLAPTPAPIACDGTLPQAAGSKKPEFAKAEDQKLNRKKTYILRLQTSCGQIDVKLALAKSPKTVNSVVFLTRKGLYDGLTFHRVVADFAIQGGDPKGDGSGGPGYKVTEAPPKDLKYTKGVVAMAKGGPEPAGTSGSQFFIVPGDGAGTLPAEYALLGEVIAGQTVVDSINQVAGRDEKPTKKIFIEKATIVEQ